MKEESNLFRAEKPRMPVFIIRLLFLSVLCFSLGSVRVDLYFYEDIFFCPVEYRYLVVTGLSGWRTSGHCAKFCFVLFTRSGKCTFWDCGGGCKWRWQAGLDQCKFWRQHFDRPDQ